MVVRDNLRRLLREQKRQGIEPQPVKRVLQPPAWWGTDDEIDAGNWAAVQVLRSGGGT